MTPHETAGLRRAELAKIHLAAKRLGLEKDDYRVIVARISARFRATPTDSAGEMTAAERRALLDEFARLGFRAAPPREKANDWIKSDIPHVRKVLACAFELERIGAVQSDSTRRWLRKFVKKLTGRDAIQWLTPQDCNKCIEALKAWRKKFEAKHQQAAAKKTPANNASAANVRAKTAAFEAMRIISTAAQPVEYIRKLLDTLSSGEFATPEKDAAAAELIGRFAARVRDALHSWDYDRARIEVRFFIERMAELEPEHVLASLAPSPREARQQIANSGAKDGGKDGTESA